MITLKYSPAPDSIIVRKSPVYSLHNSFSIEDFILHPNKSYLLFSHQNESIAVLSLFNFGKAGNIYRKRFEPLLRTSLWLFGTNAYDRRFWRQQVVPSPSTKAFYLKLCWALFYCKKAKIPFSSILSNILPPSVTSVNILLIKEE